MRIRKTVSKLLGSSIVYPSHHSPPSSDLWAPPAIDTSGLVCELNQSPWDVYPNLHLFNNNFQVRSHFIDFFSFAFSVGFFDSIPDLLYPNRCYLYLYFFCVRILCQFILLGFPSITPNPINLELFSYIFYQHLPDIAFYCSSVESELLVSTICRT